jgi:AcrR family transcriptional regulator
LIAKLGINKSSFYYFFENKEDLIREIVEKYIVAYEENKVQEIFSQEKSTEVKFRQMLQATLDYEKFLKLILDKDIDIRNLLRFSSEDVVRSVNLDIYDKYYFSRLELLKQSIENDKVKKLLPEYLDSEEFAIHLITCYEGMVNVWSMYRQIDFIRYMDINIQYLFRDFH